MMDGYVNENEIRKAITQLIPDGNVFEVRILQGSRKAALSGYFTNADELLKAMTKVDLRRSNVYITLQQLHPDCICKPQQNTFIAGAASTNDDTVVGYQWLFIDLDPERLADIPSSDDEIKAAFELAKRICSYMSELGFSQPVKAVSGNGAHLLYRIALANTDANKQLLSRCLNALADMFDNEQVKVDTANFNPSRICKLYGTLAQKGSPNENRPHRMAYILGEARQCEPTPKAVLEKLAAELKVEEVKPAKYNNYNPKEFDIEEWMAKYGITYKSKMPYKDGHKYVLDACPFNSDHRYPDSVIYVTGSGAIGFKCSHKSCEGNHWQELRRMFEPDAYEQKAAEIDKALEAGMQRHNRLKSQSVRQADGPVFRTMAEVDSLVEPEHDFILTGITELDTQTNGLEKPGLSVLSGLRGAAKSTIITQIMLNAVNAGHNVICYSGELTAKRFMSWVLLQAAGAEYIIQSQKFPNSYAVEDGTVRQAIIQWLGNRLLLYNNDHGNNFDAIYTEIEKAIIQQKSDLVVIDNLMALNLQNLRGYDKYDQQTEFVWRLKDLANKYNVHVLFVAHPTKAQGFLRLNDISGSGNITNIVDLAFIIHRVNADYKRLTKEMFKWAEHETYSASNVIEVCKDRLNGTQDVFIPLYYDVKSKRLNNSPRANVRYGWRELLPETDREEEPF